MLRVPITQVRPGMTLAMPVLHPQNQAHVLLRTGFEIDQPTLAKLREHDVASVWVRYPGLDFVGRFISPALERSRGSLVQMVAGVVERMAVDASTPGDYAAYRGAVRGLIDTAMESRDAALLVQNMRQASHPLVRHSADVCFLSMLMGMRLEHYLVLQRDRLPEHRARSIVDLAMAALVHDAGLLALKPGELERWAREGCDASDEAWREHVTIGYERVREHLGPAASAAVLHHHQRYDGSGFPERNGSALAGEDIHIYARILFAANMFDRLRFPIVGERAPSVRVLRRMQQEPYVNWVDPVVFRALLSVAPAYPPGTIVGLSTGEEAAVIDWSASDPCRPVVQVLDDTLRLGVDGPKRYDLRLRRDIVVTRVDDDDVEADNFYPSREGEFELYIANNSAMRVLGEDGETASAAA